MKKLKIMILKSEKVCLFFQILIKKRKKTNKRKEKKKKNKNKKMEDKLQAKHSQEAEQLIETKKEIQASRTTTTTTATIANGTAHLLHAQHFSPFDFFFNICLRACLKLKR